MELSNEDNLRLNVLVQNVEAIRIDEQTLVVYGLSGKTEAKVQLHPTSRGDKYLKTVREFLASSALGTPSGYPLHLQRWTRMGQARDTNLAELLMLGEPEAVTAVVHAPGLTDELARRAWWAAPHSDHAIRMLEREAVVHGDMGRVLARHLVEHLPFETEPRVVIDTIRLVLQPGLIDADTRQRLWESGARQHTYRVGFLEAQPDDLPQPLPARPDLARHRESLEALIDAGNVVAACVHKVLEGQGQTFVTTCEDILQRAANQDVMVALLNAIGRYFSSAWAGDRVTADLDALVADAQALCASAGCGAMPNAVVKAIPELAPDVAAVLVLSRVDESIVTPLFAKTTAVGALMRRKLEPVARVLRQQLATLHRT